MWGRLTEAGCSGDGDESSRVGSGPSCAGLGLAWTQVEADGCPLQLCPGLKDRTGPPSLSLLTTGVRISQRSQLQAGRSLRKLSPQPHSQMWNWHPLGGRCRGSGRCRGRSSVDIPPIQAANWLPKISSEGFCPRVPFVQFNSTNAC